MIEYIRGEINELTPTTVVLESSGVGFLLNISLVTYTALQNAKTGKLYVYEVIREDTYQLFGFSSKSERRLFEQLISVSGVGGNTARMILSAYAPEELVQIIQAGDSRALKSVKGIGLKTSQRIIVDLKDKIGLNQNTILPTENGPSCGALAEEAVSALNMLGFLPQQTQKVVYELLRKQPELSIEQLIKLALKAL